MQRPNGSRRETNPLPQKITIKCIDFPSQCSIFVSFPSSCFLFNASHRRAVYGGLDDSSYLFLWMIYVPSVLLSCNCLRMNSRKGTRHCSFQRQRIVCARSLARISSCALYLHNARRSNQFDCIQKEMCKHKMSHMVVMNESLMWMDDVYCSLNGVVNSYTLLTDIYVFLFIYFYVRRNRDNPER